MRSQRSSCFLVVVFVSAAACGSSSGDRSPMPPSGEAGGGGGYAAAQPAMPPAPEDICAVQAQALCAKVSACKPTTFEVAWGTLDHCVERNRSRCMAVLRAPGTSQTSQAVQACAAALSGESCVAFLAEEHQAACAPSPGEKGDGQGCAFDEQCKSTFCRTDGTSFPPYMADVGCGECSPIKNPGDPCPAQSASDCGPARLRRYCDGRSKTCVQLGKLGDTCTTQWCDFGLDCVMQTCVTRAQRVGDDCGSETAPHCTSGLKCNAMTHRCESALANMGEICFVPPNGDDQKACRGGRCVSYNSPFMCVAPAADGMTCNDGKGFCDTFSYCVTPGGPGTCRLRDGVCDGPR